MHRCTMSAAAVLMALSTVLCVTGFGSEARAQYPQRYPPSPYTPGQAPLPPDDDHATKLPAPGPYSRPTTAPYPYDRPPKTPDSSNSSQPAAKASDYGTCEHAKGGDKIAACSRLIIQNSRDTAAYINRGLGYQNKGDHDRAIADFDQAIKLDPTSTNISHAYVGRGTAYADKNNYDRAIADFGRAIKLDPKFAPVYYNRGLAYEAKGDHDRAIADFDQAIKLNPRVADAYFNRGIAYDGKGDRDHAIADYDQALRLDPTLAEARQGRERAQASVAAQQNAARPRPWAQTPTQPTKRALVIGIDTYPNLGRAAQLERAVADAEADRLAALGFQVTRLTAARQNTLDALLRGFEAFRKTIAPNDMVVLFYAGHGMGLSDGTYLVPADLNEASLEVEATARRAAINENELTNGLRQARASIVIAVIDACRNDLFSHALGRTLGSERGLRPAETEGIFKLYSASEGQTALDRLPGSDGSRNSVFTRVFLKALGTPGLNLSALGTTVRDEVHDLARAVDHVQTPAVYDRLIGSTRVFLAGETAAAGAPADAREAAAAEAWKAVQNSNNPADLQNFIKAFPDSSLALNEATQRLGVLVREAKERIEAANARLAWDRIKDSTDQAVLQEFIARYANTPIAQIDAKNRLEELRRRQRDEAEASAAWNKIKATDNPAQLRDFANRYPASPLAIDAAQRASALEREIKERAEKAATEAAASALWNKIKNTNDPAVVRNFIERYPDSPLALNDAQRRLDVLDDEARKSKEAKRAAAEAAAAWGKIKDTSDPAELRRFIDRYPASPLAFNDAKKRLVVLEREAAEVEKKARADADAAAAWDKIKDTRDPAELRGFIKSYPNSRLASQDAKERLADIEAQQKKCTSGEILKGHTCVESSHRPNTPIASASREPSDRTKAPSPETSTSGPVPARQEPAPHYEVTVPHSGGTNRPQSGVGF